ncbi:hypothetical protein [Thalassobacillus sp. CUG 92003]|uniref:hypothetical protein n=1 Tax=Thalassobacillus sp. CUG 92003 TaxID=2736641 RepID=UPI0015E6EEC8|nr:hypothetical protein [Thalassobacillus sp. CUG 92003]
MSFIIILVITLGVVINLFRVIHRNWSNPKEKFSSSKSSSILKNFFSSVRSYYSIKADGSTLWKRKYSNFSIFSNLTVRNILRKFSLTIFSVIIFYGVVFYVIPRMDFFLSLSLSIPFKMGFTVITPELVLRVIDVLTRILFVLLSLSLTFYYFIYRVQKSSYESAVNNMQSNMAMLKFVLIAIITLVLGFHFKILYESDVGFYQDRIKAYTDIWLAFILLTLYYFYKMVRDLYLTTHIDSFLRENIDVFNITYRKIYFSESRKKAIIYDSWRNNIEIIYQVLHLTVSKDILGVYFDRYYQWINGSLSALFQEELDENHGTPYEHFLKRDQRLFIDLYGSILKKQLSLIATLNENHRIEEQNDAIEHLFNLFPRNIKHSGEKWGTIEQTVTEKYITVIEELGIVMYGYHQNHTNSIGIKKYLYMIEKTIKDENNKIAKEFLSIYKTLFIKALEIDDEKMVSTLCHSLVRCGNFDSQESMQDSSEFEQQVEDTAEYLPEVKAIHPDDLKELFNYFVSGDEATQIVSVQPGKNHENFNRSVVRLFMLTALKTVELSSYAITSIFVKFIVTNFPSKQTHLVFNDLNSKYENNELEDLHHSRNEVNFNFHSHSLKYCFLKFSTLLLGQQLYVHHYPTTFNKIINEDHIIRFYVERNDFLYIFNKISNSDGYSLIWMEGELIKELKHSMEYKLFQEVGAQKK